MLEILKKRRSIRKYSKTPVEMEKVETLLKAALLSPSSRGLNPWSFIVVDDPALLNELARAKEHGSSFLKNAPLGIVVIGDPQKCDVWVEDCSIAALIIHISASSLGLGSCWIQIRERHHSAFKTSEQYVREVLAIPDELKVEAIIAIGYPEENKPPRPEPGLPNAKIHFNRFSSPN